MSWYEMAFFTVRLFFNHNLLLILVKIFYLVSNKFAMCFLHIHVLRSLNTLYLPMLDKKQNIYIGIFKVRSLEQIRTY